MRTKWIVFAVALPIVLACGGVPGLPSAEKAEEEPVAGVPDAVTELDAAIDALDIALTAAEAADGAVLNPVRVDAAKATATEARTALEAPVQQVMSLGQ